MLKRLHRETKSDASMRSGSLGSLDLDVTTIVSDKVVKFGSCRELRQPEVLERNCFPNVTNELTIKRERQFGKQSTKFVPRLIKTFDYGFETFATSFHGRLF